MEYQLILAAKKGNKRAFADLMKVYARKVYYAAYSFVKNSEDAADISQEVFIKAYTNLDAFDEKRSFFPWIYCITKNLSLNRLKRHENKNTSLPEYDFIVSKYNEPDQELLQKEDLTYLKKAINKLPENFKEIIILKHIEECSYAEISEILEIPKGTVMSRLYNARQKLREIIDGQEQSL
jgi:RNA polymerase sigma-70 factor, ECF subfamily